MSILNSDKMNISALDKKMDINEIINIDKKYYMNTFGDRTRACFEKGDGIFLYDTENKKYADFLGGIAVNVLGHHHSVFVCELKKQIDKVLHTSSLYYIKNQALLAKKLCDISCGDKVFFANSGAEANEGAIKLARAYFKKKNKPNKTEFITLLNSFHGRTLTTAAATGQTKYSRLYTPLTPGFHYAGINDIGGLKSVLNENTCAIMLEPIQGESGVHPLDEEYIQQVRDICDKNDILLIFDEVQTGIGRTGKMFGYMHYGVEPDIFTLAKALGGGIPIGAVVAKGDAANTFEPGDHGTTFGGNPFACFAALTVLDILEKDGLVENADKTGNYLISELNNLKQILPVICEIRGRGLMIGIQLNGPIAADVKRSLFEAGYLVGSIGENIIRLLPPLITTQADVDAFIKVLKEVLSEKEPLSAAETAEH